jgi:type I restriction enzyme S subunit
MSVEKNVPDIRFKGFNGDWNNLVLGENARFAKGQGYSKGDLVTNGTPIILYGRLYTRFQAVIADVDTFVNEGPKPIKSIGGEVIVPASGESPEDISRAAVVSEPNVILGGDLNVIYPNRKIDSIFLALAISNGRLKKELSSKAQGKSVVHIRNSDLEGLSLILPSEKPEQTQIGNTFQKLDNLINQHQQKHDKLSSIKKAMLEKMFPKQGETIPEIRFKGFSGDWEEIRLGDMVTCFSGGTPLVGVEEYYKGNIPFIRSAEINKASTELTISESGLKNSSAKIVEVGTVLYALYGATSGEVGRAKLSGAINQAILAIIPMAKMCPEFLSHWLRKSKNSIISTYLQGGQGNLSGDIVKNLVLMSPTFEEQIAIGNYFQKLDTLINQHQQQITKLNNIKQACLSKMFV